MSASLRIYRVPKSSPKNLNTEIKESPYYDRLIKLIPAEIVALYVAGANVIPQDQKTASWVWAAILLILLLFVRAKGTTSDETPNVQWASVIIAAISFIIWVYIFGGKFITDLPFYQAYIGSLTVLLWTFAVPYFYKGDQT